MGQRDHGGGRDSAQYLRGGRRGDVLGRGEGKTISATAWNQREIKSRDIANCGVDQGRSQDLVSGGGDPPFFASDPKSQGSPLMYFWLPLDFGGGAPPPAPPGYVLGVNTVFVVAEGALR